MNIEVKITTVHEVDPAVAAVIASEFLEWLDSKSVEINAAGTELSALDFRQLGDEFAKAAADRVIKRG